MYCHWPPCICCSLLAANNTFWVIFVLIGLSSGLGESSRHRKLAWGKAVTCHPSGQFLLLLPVCHFFLRLLKKFTDLCHVISAFCSYLTTAIAWHTVGVEYFLVPGLFSCALTTVMGCRFILNLCEAYRDPFVSVVNLDARSSRVTSGGITFMHLNELESRLSVVEDVRWLWRKGWPGPT